ncbi:MAG TPA: hypothetical protein PKD83_00230 [Ignavibacteria bacterium]|nr:hypothetical protein [Ignavibacteria bacterium]
MHLNKTAKTSLFILIVGAIFWLGAINVRFFIGNQLLNYDEFNFRTSIPPDEENQIFKMVADASMLIMVFYPIVLISAIIFMKSCGINLRENPWLLMSAILFFVFVPVEFYTSYLDLKFILLFNQRPENHDRLLELFGERIGFLRGVPWIAVMCYYTIIWMSVFKPLKKTLSELEEEEVKLQDVHGYKYIFHEDDDLIINVNSESK